MSAWAVPDIGGWLFAGGLLGALLTSIYSFKLVFVVFFGQANTEPDNNFRWKMAAPLSLLCGLSLIGGWFALPLEGVFPQHKHGEINHTIEAIAIATPLVGLLIAYLLFLGKQLSINVITESSSGKALQNFFHHGWRFDALYQLLLWPPGVPSATHGRPPCITKAGESLDSFLRPGCASIGLPAGSNVQ